MNDKAFMKTALDLAQKAKGRTSPNPVVGAVIVKNKKIIAKGWHKGCGSDHAEIVAIKAAKTSVVGARLYVTLEPCNHYGRTPPCVDKIIEKGIKEVIIAMRDPNPLTNGKSIAKLKRHKIKVTVGVLKEEAQKINENYLKYITKKMPFVVAKCAQTLDGKIATRNQHSKWITADRTRNVARQTRDEFDAIVVGVNTVINDDPRLTGLKKKNILKIVLDSSLKIPLKSKVLKSNPQTCIIATTNKSSKRKQQLVSKTGARVIVCPHKRGRVNLKWLFKEFAKQEITNLLLEGGAQVIGNALQENLVDKMHIYLAPKIMGDQMALSSVDGLRPISVAKSIHLRDLTIEKIGKDLLIKGYVLRNR